MTVPKAQTLIEAYSGNSWLVHHLVDGLTHEESLLQLPFETNCLNWALGHIVTNRSHALEAAGAEHAWKDEVRALYHTGSAPIHPESQAIRIETLLQYLDESDTLLKAALETFSEEKFEELFTNYRGEKSRHSHIAGFHWHETYHIGQLEIFKALALGLRKDQ